MKESIKRAREWQGEVFTEAVTRVGRMAMNTNSDVMDAIALIDSCMYIYVREEMSSVFTKEVRNDFTVGYIVHSTVYIVHSTVYIVH